MQSIPTANSTQNPVKESTGMKQMMKQIELQSARLLAGASGLFLVLALAPAGFAQQAQTQANQTVGAAQPSQAIAASTAKPSAKLGEEEEDAATPSKSGSEGIKVHGHWVLQVKNADGTLGERREFNNSLVASGGMMTGDQVLASLLSGNASSGGLAIAFISGPTTTTGLDVSAFCDYPNHAGQIAVPNGISCFGFYPTSGAFQAGDAGQIEVNVQGQAGLSNVVSFSPNVNIILSGNFTVPSALGALGSINAVQTFASLCMATNTTEAKGYRMTGSNNAFLQADLSPQKCIGTPAGEYVEPGVLTSTNVSSGGVPAPLMVTAGQIITVTVTLSFS